jgi:glycosyltransferase domain-containing protein
MPVDLKALIRGAMSLRPRAVPKDAASSGVWSVPPGELLTAVIPTHNRVKQCLALLRFLRSCGFEHPIVVADSSRPDRARALEKAVTGLARYQYYDQGIAQYSKFARIAQCAETPYLVCLPDDDILFPHAIEAALAHLQGHSDHVAAHGYSLRFGLERGDFDIYKVEHFIPTIADEAPMRRYFHMMQRYQPHVWAVFRREAYATAMEAAALMKGTVFQEFMFQIVSVLLGKVARLPLIYAMRGMEESHVDYSEADPFQWLIKDADSLFKSYAVFRQALLNFLRFGNIHPKHDFRRFFEWGIGIDNPRRVQVEQIIDLINASYLVRVTDSGVVNYAAQYALGDVDAPVKFPGPWAGWSAPRAEDLVRASRRTGRQYVWRRAVIEAEPKEEIRIDREEIARVEAQLDNYDLKGPRMRLGKSATWLVS